MADPTTRLISCRSAAEIVRAMDAAMPRLPAALRDQFDRVTVSYLQRYGKEGLYERVNNRTVAAILAEFDNGDELRMIDSGEVDGIPYELLESPDPMRKEETERKGKKR